VSRARVGEYKRSHDLVLVASDEAIDVCSGAGADPDDDGVGHIVPGPLWWSCPGKARLVRRHVMHHEEWPGELYRAFPEVVSSQR
jgi:hypothetical protein